MNRLALRLVLTTVVLGAVDSAAQEVTVRPDHPRIWIAAGDPIAGLEKMRQRANAGKVVFPPGMAGDALRWLLLDDAEAARRALAELRKPIPGAESLYGLRDAGLAFDWLYSFPEFTPELKREVALAIASRINAARNDILTCPALSNGQVKATNPAIAALATHGDWPGSDKAIAAINSRMIDDCLGLFDELLPCGDWPESLDYQRQSVRYLVQFYEAWRTATRDERILNSPFLRNCIYPILYKTLPNGMMSPDDDNDNPFPTWKNWMIPSYAVGVWGNRQAQSYIKSGRFLPEPPGADALPVAIWLDPDLPPEPLDEIPPDHFFRGSGDVVMRDGWGEDSRWIQFKCGDFLAKHNHFDQAHFAIYYKGYLAIDSGAWTGEDDLHTRNYARRTIAHNTMLIHWAEEKFSFADTVCEANDGGQYMGVPDRFPGRRAPKERHYWFWNTITDRARYEDRKEAYETGTMLGLEADGRTFACAKCDATKAYNETKIGYFFRTLLYLKPDVLLVYDQVASKPEGGWLESYCPKTWLLHAMEEPQVEGAVVAQGNGFKTCSGRQYTVTHGDGRLIVKTLLPAATTVTARGGPGYEFWVNGTNYPVVRDYAPQPKPGETFGAWRLEVQPKENREHDMFLHLIYITEKDQDKLPLHSLVESDDVAGVVVGARAGLFVKSTTSPTQVAFAVQQKAKLDCYLMGLALNKPFTVTSAGRKVAQGVTGELGLARFAVEGPGEFGVAVTG